MSKNDALFQNHSSLKVVYPREVTHLLMNHTSAAIVLTSINHRINKINQSYTDLLGYREQDALGTNLYTHLRLKKDNILKPFQDKAEAKGIHKDGHLINLELSHYPIYDSLEQIVGGITFIKELPDTECIEDIVSNNLGISRLITEHTSDLILLYGLDKKVIYVSPSFEELLGLEKGTYLGKGVMDHMNKEEREYSELLYKKINDTGESQILQSRMKTSNGNIIYIESNISPIFNEFNEIQLYVCVGRDVTDRVKNDDALRNLDRLSIIGQLAASVAHEIRNPLTSLKGFSKLLHYMEEKDKQKEYLSIISHELERIDGIVNEFMSLAKPQVVDYDYFDLYEILEATFKFLHPQAMMCNVQIRFIKPNQSIELLCNQNQLKQVFINFLKNSIESMPNGGEVIIAIEVLRNKRVRINFKDEGIGISSDRLHYLGTPFYTTKDKGIGLGLTVSNKIIQEHNGTMKIDSKPGGGTVVTVELGYS
ncbi:MULTISPECIES: PAS domain S-box protein [Cytobacillus]|uniref:histidine kinase n=1 Tax=Cytobacillus stercorigallinarum TaxID=2762240 RepID=A0ABR8QRU9_9BACI|nr:PAS domain S-box protein [Cytobacillus stercorigallinarum]MBD7938268.1 PAS domain S-box protein [Cytobacillus stercorigallinarum]